MVNEKVFVWFSRCLVIIVAVMGQEYSYIDENYGITWMYFPDGNGIPNVVNLTQPPAEDTSAVDSSERMILVGRGRGRGSGRTTSIRKSIHFELYTREHKRQPKKMQLRPKRDDVDDFNANFRPDAETKIIIHGWRSSTSSDTVQNIKDAYLYSMDCNIIAVDWADAAANPFYYQSAAQTRDVGRYVAELIDFLVAEHKIRTRHIHIIGHSLGAHAAGYAGSFTRTGRVARITGLDPAMPGFSRSGGPEQRLDPTDALFVDVIHTCGGFLGYLDPLGHIDFYPNSGRPSQPGCTGFAEALEACSHGRSHQFFAESIDTRVGFYAVRCKSWDAYSAGECGAGETIIMGDHVPLFATGIFYLRTNSHRPFAMGRSNETTTTTTVDDECKNDIPINYF